MENQPQRASSAAAQWIEAHRPWVAGVALVGALSMTVLWSIIVPETTNQASGLRWFVLRWGHAACWAALSLAVFTWTVRGPSVLSQGFAWGGLACYGGFLLALA